MRRKKATVWDLMRLGIAWFRDERVKNDAGDKGYRYTLSRNLTDEQKEALGKFKNVILSSCQYRHAPEIHHDVVILLDKIKA